MEFKKKMINSVGKLADEEAEEGATTGKFKPKDLLDATVNFRIASKGRN